MEESIKSVEDLQRELMKAVWKNESLRQEIMRDPVHTIQRILGIKIPDNLKVKVIDETEENVIYLVLPHHPNNIFGFELNEDQLDKVAGGMIVPPPTPINTSAPIGVGPIVRPMISTATYINTSTFLKPVIGTAMPVTGTATVPRNVM